MPNMGITKWSKNYDVTELSIAIITVTKSLGRSTLSKANKHKKVQMVLLPHSAFIGLEGSYINQSAEILHDYHNVPLKNSSNMMTATRNYIPCFSTSCVICGM